MLPLMRRPDEVRDSGELPLPALEVSEREIGGPLVLMGTMAREDLEGEQFRDRCTETLPQVIDAKREHREPAAETPESEEKPSRVLDLAALNESVARARQDRGEDDADVHEMPKPKMRAAKKATARRSRPA